jgi:myo-inositol-1(or 4)-monophosphatase
MDGDSPVDDPIELAERAALAGGEVAMSHFRTDFDVREKSGKMDPVTVADTETQDRIVGVLRDAGVTAPIVGEEGEAPKTLPDEGRAWVIDPIDGTNNFARGTHLWGVCVAVAEGGEPAGGATVLPALGETYVAGADGATRDGTVLSVSDREDPAELLVAPVFGLKDRDRPQYRAVTAAVLDSFGDVRQTGSGQTTLALVAADGVDAAVSTVPMAPWDTLLGVSLVRNAGGRVTDLDGERWHHDCESLIATNGACHDVVLDVVRDAVAR